MRLVSFILSKKLPEVGRMDLKEKVLETLEQNKGHYISGAELAETLFVSRNTVWKAVKALTAEGHRITAVTNKGYCLETASDVLSKAGIEKFLGSDAEIFDVEFQKSCVSTNALVKERAAAGEKEGKVIVAGMQTSGRGRHGRSFYSPEGTGVYFSLLLRPGVTASDAVLITTAAATAAAQAIESVTGLEASIKWVNDIYVRGKKVCGILTEGAFDMESGGLQYAVLGIGINVAAPEGGFPGELSGIAGSLYDGAPADSDIRSRVIAETLRKFWAFYMKLTEKTYLVNYRERSFVVGRDVDVVTGDLVRRARALAIDDSCRLVVRYEVGKIEALSSGEVSVRPIKGEHT
jgi:BirA family biotin operon repressor/biotin-[acetyl-CoA-carboxylase] ligase